MKDNKIYSTAYYIKKYPGCYVPDVDELLDWMSDGGCETPSGEWVEADGWDSEGNPSWMLIYGLI